MTASHHPQEQNYQQQTATYKETKSLFTSKTVWGILFTSIAAIAPIVGKDIDKFMQGKKDSINYGEDAAQIVVILCGAAASVVGRVEAKTTVYTPKYLPGPNKKMQNENN